MTYYNVSHKMCDDGGMSSAIVKKFKPEAVVIMSAYDEAWKKIEYKEGDYILFTDFCPKPEEAWELYEKGVYFDALDHHISTINNYNEYRKTNPERSLILDAHVHIDQSGKCGATMTWDWFANEEQKLLRPLVLKYIEIADTWDWSRDENAKYITQYIRVVTRQGEWEDMAKLLEFFDYGVALEYGKILYQRLMLDVKALAKKAHLIYIDGIEVLAVNSGHDLSISELGHELSEKSENGVGLVYNIAYNEVKISVRGRAGTTLAREIAEKLGKMGGRGGGGHNEAAGSRYDIPGFIKLFKKP